ncbi:MAG: formyltransferase, partial [Gammaproteobacteria bacterium]
MTRAVVFAYHDVGVRCLSALIDAGVDVGLVVTHQDNPAETIWFASVAQLANRAGIPVVTPDDPAAPSLLEQVRALRPDFIFSFYYRHILPEALLSSASQGALNMHGSLLPRYRGRVPVNWAIIRGEAETGASLHYMTARPDAGDLVDQQAVPILINDTALDVFRKVTCAAEQVLHRSLPGLLDGSAPRQPLDLARGEYLGGRRPADGRIDWSRPAVEVHNLIRAVAPPYPGAFCDSEAGPLAIFGSWYRGEAARHPDSAPCLYRENEHWFADCVDGRRLLLTELTFDGGPLS